jgi:hypothetical protein
MSSWDLLTFWESNLLMQECSLGVVSWDKSHVGTIIQAENRNNFIFEFGFKGLLGFL